jgi:hypothetical protein
MAIDPITQHILNEDATDRAARAKSMLDKEEKELQKDVSFYEKYCHNVERGSVQAYTCKQTKQRMKEHKKKIRIMKATFGAIRLVDKTISKLKPKNKRLNNGK